MAPPCEPLVNGKGDWFSTGHMVCHCLLIETEDGLVLVDAGLGTADIKEPLHRLGHPIGGILSDRCTEDITALRQIEKLGYRREDVRHIVLTHLDLDHAGGISDFPDAAVHVYRAEHTAAMSPLTISERERYRSVHWAHGPKWQLHDDDGEMFEGLAAVRAIVEPDVLLIPMTGHSRGHACVAVNSGDGWLVHCGDAYFHHTEMENPKECPWGLSLFQRIVATDNDARVHNQQRLRALHSRGEGRVKVFSAHDPVELDRMLAPADSV